MKYLILLGVLAFALWACDSAPVEQPIPGGQSIAHAKERAAPIAPSIAQRQKANPWGYTFTPGVKIFAPPQTFCSVFACIPHFFTGKGYVVECRDGLYAKSGGRRGSCSGHGGDKAILYAHR